MVADKKILKLKGGERKKKPAKRSPKHGISIAVMRKKKKKKSKLKLKERYSIGVDPAEAIN